MYDIKGATAISLTNQIMVKGDNKISIPINNIHQGLYILEIETAEGIITEKIIVE
jgi:LEA14-like dessication related protein